MYVPGLDYGGYCPACIEAKMLSCPHKKFLENENKAEPNFDLVNADYKGPYPESLPDKHRQLLNFRDQKSGWVTSYTSKERRECGDLLQIYCEKNPTGKPPKRVRTDNASEFKGKNSPWRRAI